MDSATALQALNSFQPTSSADILSQAQSKYGVQDLSARVDALRGLTNNLTNSIAAVDPSVTGRTSGSLVTEAQRSALVNKERQPLLTSLGQENQALSGATSDLNTGRSLASELARSMAGDQTAKYDQLKDQYNLANARETAAQAEADRQAAAKQSQSNEDRNFALASSKAASTSSNAKPTTSDMQSAASQLDSYLSTKKGGDNFLSPYDYNAAKSAWTQDGFSPAQFEAIFGKYKNPNQPKNQYK